MYKLCVYAICKNESKFVDRWIDSLIGEADHVVVLDTGSTDDTVERLKGYEPFVSVYQYDYFSNLGYFRFDKARNDSLKLVPYEYDICVVLDLDQVPQPGWANVIKQRFEEGYSEVRGDIVDHSGQTTLNRWTSRNVHPNSPFWIWNKVIHEGIEYYGNEEIKTIYDSRFVIDHYPDDNKDRSLYRDLLEFSCKEYPKDPYYGIYLGIELSRRYSKEEAISAFERCLSECDFENNEFIHYQVYSNLAGLLLDKNNLDYALDITNKAKELAKEKGINNTRRLYSISANIYERLEDYDSAINDLLQAMTIVYSNDWRDDIKFYKGYIEDKLSLLYYYKKFNYLKALEFAIKAFELDSSNERLKSNLDFCYNKYLESRGIYE